MPQQDSQWEGLLLAFAMIFTVLLGVAYGVGVLLRIPVPWFATLVAAVVATLGLAYVKRARGRP